MQRTRAIRNYRKDERNVPIPDAFAMGFIPKKWQAKRKPRMTRTYIAAAVVAALLPENERKKLQNVEQNASKKG